MTTPRRDPTPAEWRRLYERALAFRDRAPWHAMGDTDVFGVQDPDTGEIGWCVVLGGSGQVFGLGVYAGTSGLGLHLAIASGEVEAEGAGFAMDGWLLTFEDRQALDARDLGPLRALGLRVRGRRAWPQFRSLKANYAPWYLDSREAVFVAHVLDQVADVVDRFAGRPGELAPTPDMRFLVRVPEVVGGALRWHDRRMVPPPPPEPPAAPPFDEVRAARLRARAPRVDATWECAYFFAPVTVGGPGERPFVPPALMLVDAASGVVLDVRLGEEPADAAALHGSILASVETIGSLPAVVHVGDEALRDQLEPLAKALGVGVAVVGGLPALEAAREAMERHFGRGRGTV